MINRVSGLEFKPNFGAKLNLNVECLGNISSVFRIEEIFVRSLLKQYFVKIGYVGTVTADTSLICGSGSSVGIATGYGQDGPGSNK
jgi:hypothetical protein